MDQWNQVAESMVNILSEWKVENDRYKQKIDKFQTGLDAQVVSMQNFIKSNSTTQSNDATAERASGKRSLPQSSNENAAAVPPKRMKSNEGISLTTGKLLADCFFFC